MITWDAVDERFYQTGVDRGVLYPTTGPAVPWNGITGVQESGNGSSTVYYIDGQIYLADVDPTDFEGSLTAFSAPPEFAACIGQPQIAEGLFADNQKGQRFNLSYRSLVGNGLAGDMFGYQIHLIYNCVATIGAKQRKTLTGDPNILEMTFDIQATPVKVTGFRPTAHFVIDTRYLTPESVAELEEMLYGESAAMPDAQVLFDMMNFGDAIIVTEYPSGFVKIEGKSSNIVQLTEDTFQINNINADTSDPDGEVIISDGGDTDVIIA